MFSFNATPTFTALVEVWEPGATAAQTFTGRFQAIPTAETERLQGAGVPVAQIAAANREWLRAIFVGWDDDLTVDGAPLAVTPANLEMVLAAPWVQSAVTLAYLRSVAGAARKN